MDMDKRIFTLLPRLRSARPASTHLSNRLQSLLSPTNRFVAWSRFAACGLVVPARPRPPLKAAGLCASPRTLRGQQQFRSGAHCRRFARGRQSAPVAGLHGRTSYQRQPGPANDKALVKLAVGPQLRFGPVRLCAKNGLTADRRRRSTWLWRPSRPPPVLAVVQAAPPPC